MCVSLWIIHSEPGGEDDTQVGGDVGGDGEDLPAMLRIAMQAIKVFSALRTDWLGAKNIILWCLF